METAWFMIVAFMLVCYVILDGFDIGAGIIHYFVGRNEKERGGEAADEGDHSRRRRRHPAVAGVATLDCDPLPEAEVAPIFQEAARREGQAGGAELRLGRQWQRPSHRSG